MVILLDWIQFGSTVVDSRRTYINRKWNTQYLH